MNLLAWRKRNAKESKEFAYGIVFYPRQAQSWLCCCLGFWHQWPELPSAGGAGALQLLRQARGSQDLQFRTHSPCTVPIAAVKLSLEYNIMNFPWCLSNPFVCLTVVLLGWRKLSPQGCWFFVAVFFSSLISFLLQMYSPPTRLKIYL